MKFLTSIGCVILSFCIICMCIPGLYYVDPIESFSSFLQAIDTITLPVRSAFNEMFDPYEVTVSSDVLSENYVYQLETYDSMWVLNAVNDSLSSNIVFRDPGTVKFYKSGKIEYNQFYTPIPFLDSNETLFQYYFTDLLNLGNFGSSAATVMSSIFPSIVFGYYVTFVFSSDSILHLYFINSSFGDSSKAESPALVTIDLSNFNPILGSKYLVYISKTDYTVTVVNYGG